MQELSKEAEEKRKLVLNLCICRGCSSYISCGELGFCFQTIGKSKCIKREIECECPHCPITKKSKLKNIYYCTRGSEKNQTGGKNFTFQ